MQRDSCTFAPPNDLLAPPTFVVLFTGEREDTGRPKRSRCLLHHPVLTYCSTNTQPDDSGCVGDGPVWCTGCVHGASGTEGAPSQSLARAGIPRLTLPSFQPESSTVASSSMQGALVVSQASSHPSDGSRASGGLRRALLQQPKGEIERAPASRLGRWAHFVYVGHQLQLRLYYLKSLSASIT